MPLQQSAGLDDHSRQTSAAKTGADQLVERLILHGVKHVFGMPGSHSTAIYDALARAGSITTILTRNEQAGAFMADGYARVSGRPGVICTTAGPGATNALSGVAEAWADSVPLLLLAGQVNAADLDRERGNYHEIDLEAIFRPVTKWCGTVRHGEQIPAMVGQAFQAMTIGRPPSRGSLLAPGLDATTERSCRAGVAVRAAGRASRRSKNHRASGCHPLTGPAADHSGRRRCPVGRCRRRGQAPG